MSHPAEREIRTRLEGLVERIEDELVRVEAVRLLLRAGNARKAIAERPAELPALAARVEGLWADIRRIREKAETEGWRGSEAEEKAARLSGLISEVEADARALLPQLSATAQAGRLPELLVTLASVCVRPPPQPLLPDERVILHGALSGGTSTAKLGAGLLFGGLALPALGASAAAGGIALLSGMGALSFAALQGLFWRGRYWLTTERLLLEQRGLGRAETTLSTVTGVTCFMGEFVSVKGDRNVAFGPVANGADLAATIRLYAKPSLRNRLSDGARTALLSFEAWRVPDRVWAAAQQPEDGALLLGPGFALFVPRGEVDAVVEALTGARPSGTKPDLSALVAPLSLLPAKELREAWLRSVALGKGLVFLSPQSARVEGREHVGGGVRFADGQNVISIKATSGNEAALTGLLERWR